MGGGDSIIVLLLNLTAINLIEKESEKGEVKGFATEVEKNLERINALIDNNKKLEKCLFSATQYDKQRPSVKRKSLDMRSSSGSLSQSHSASRLGRLKSDRTHEQRKKSYTPYKVILVFLIL